MPDGQAKKLRRDHIDILSGILQRFDGFLITRVVLTAVALCLNAAILMNEKKKCHIHPQRSSAATTKRPIPAIRQISAKKTLKRLNPPVER